MKGKKIFERIVVSVLVLALALSNVSVAADSGNMTGAGTEQQEPEAPEGGHAGSEEIQTEAVDESASSQPPAQTDTPPGASSAEEGIGSPEGTEPDGGTAPDGNTTPNMTPDTAAPDGDTVPGENTVPSENTVPGENTTPAPAVPDTAPDGTGPDGEAPDGTVPDESTMPDGTLPEEGLTDGDIPEEDNTEEIFQDSEEEEPLDLTDMYTLEELTGLSDEEAEYTIWMSEDTDEEAPALFSAMFRTARVQRDWGFDIYYVNQDDSYDVRHENNFSLKYQMQFKTSQNLAKGAVQIKIESELLKDRDGRPVTPEDIGLPYGTPGDPSTGSRTLFNYYTVTEETERVNEDGETVTEDKEYLVFFNCRSIPAGTNTAWQVLYKNLRLMNLIDESSWTLTPQVFVDETAGNIPEGEEEPVPAKTYDEVMGMGDEGFDSGSWPLLTGSIDSSVSITSVSKTPYYQTGVNYTPGLYTVAQLERYIQGTLPEDSIYRDRRNPNRLSSMYQFVVWDVKVKGQATQPWDLYILDHPFQETETDDNIEELALGSDRPAFQPAVVGYLDNRSAGYGLPITEPDPATGVSSVNQKEESWGSRFYVVTAYPVSGDAPLKNEITIKLHPVDGKDEDVEKTSSTASWEYKEYDWAYKGEVLGIRKTTDKTRYTGWLDVYRSAKAKGEDYGDMPFTTIGTMNGYIYTHETEGSWIGEYEAGNYYTLTTMDDFLYAKWDEDGKSVSSLMNGDDYYFSGITIRQEDKGYDIWEDRQDSSELGKIDSDLLPDNFKGEDETVRSEVRIWAKFAAGAAAEGTETKKCSDGTVWEKVDTVYMGASGSAEYTFGDDLISRMPYRVMVEHDSIDYTTSCTINVKVRMRAGSPVMQRIIDARGDKGRDQISTAVTFENLSGSLGAYYDWKGNTGYIAQDNAADKGGQAFNYNVYAGLEEATNQEGYGYLPIRDNAYREVTWLTQTADAFKTGVSKNDVNNGRVLVDYVLTAYDGYEIYDKSCLDDLSKRDEELISPHRSDVVFYDLLPYGVTFDGSYQARAGIIRSLDSSGSYQKNPDLWDESQVEISTEIVDADYKGSGRTLVAFRLRFTGADATSYTAGKWIEGWGVSFRAWYDWKDGGAVNDQNKINANLCAFMPDFTSRSNGSNDTHPQLLGLDGQVYKDDDTAPGGYEILAGDIDGIHGPIGAYPEINDVPHILYARYPLSDDVAVNSSGQIETLVRADADRLGAFGESTVIPKASGSEDDGFYTYKITVSTTDDLSGIVLYDHLENAAEELKNREGEPFTFNDNPWQGTFQSLNLDGLTLMGITPTVYYSKEREAQIPADDQDPSEVFNATDSEWIKVDDPGQLPKDGSVKSIAVDLGNFTLEANQSVSIQIRMKAPDVDPDKEEGYYTYNHASYSSVPKGAERITLDSRSVRAARSMPETLEVTKRFGADVPGARRDTSFEFYLYEEYEYQDETTGRTEQKKQPLAYTEYELRTADGSGSGQTQITSTDGSGRLYLHAGETAVFHLADAGRIKVEETPSVFWDTEYAEAVSREAEDGSRTPDKDGDIRTVTVTNTYRPVLYVEKQLAGVPASGANKELDAYEFEFRLMTKGALGEYSVPVADAEYWIVDAARLDGGMPAKLGSGVTGKDGSFRLRQGQIIALFPGSQGTEYQVTETDPGDDWICREPSQTGTLTGSGDSRVFTNYYRWKDLYLTKEIIGQTEADYKAMEPYPYTDGENEAVTVDPRQFTFRVERETEIGDVSSDRAKARPEPVRYEASGTEAAQSGSLPDTGEKAGRAAETDSEPVKYTADGGNTELRPVTGLTWVLLDENGAPTDTAGTLDQNGEFTCALGFGRVRISGLEADQNYVITEVKDAIAKDPAAHRPLYVPVSDTAEVKMPVFGTGRDAKITNEYQRSTLLVTKTVAGASKPEEGGADGGNEAAFTFLLLIDGREAADYPYTVSSPDGSSRTGRTGSGTEAGTFTLTSGETASFKDAGMRGQSFAVYEKEDGSCKQIYPSEGIEDREGYGVPCSGEFAGEKEEASFVNGESGYLYISKEYTASGDQAEAYLREIKKEVELGSWMLSEEAGEISNIKGDAGLYFYTSDGWTPVQGYVRMTLEAADEDGKTYTWPKKDTEVTVLNYLKPQEKMETTVTWSAGSSIRVYPWTVIMIPEKQLGSGSYVLKEQAEDQHKIINQYRVGVDFTRDKNCLLQVSQSYPADDQALAGTVAEKPNAAVYNEIKDVETILGYSTVSKMMLPGSEDVPGGSELVWRVEQYADGNWIPAEGISYMIFDQVYGNGKPFSEERPVSDRICTTGTDGEILIRKTPGTKENQMDLSFEPLVRFPQNKVYLNLYDEEDINKLREDGVPLLRVVEVPEESDSAWGQFAGYFYSKRVNTRAVLMQTVIGLDAPPALARGFVNSNRKTTIRVQKSMPEGMNAPDQTFTMILKQVLSAAGVTETGVLEAEKVEIIHSEPGADIEYTVYDADGMKTGSGRTGPGGEIRLRAGEYADVSVAYGTTWTLEEDLNAAPNYRLASLTPDPGNGQMTKLDDNRMLVRVAQQRETYTVEWYLCGENNGGHVTRLTPYKTERRTGTVGEMVYVTEADRNPEGYEPCAYHDGNPTFATLDGSGKTVLKVYVKTKVYTLHYDANGQIPNLSWGPLEDVSVKASEAAATEIQIKKWPNAPKTFLGWSETPAGPANIQTGECVTLTDGDMTLYAVWAKAPEIQWKPLVFECKGVDLSAVPRNLYMDIYANVYYENEVIDTKTIRLLSSEGTKGSTGNTITWEKAVPCIPEGSGYRVECVIAVENYSPQGYQCKLSASGNPTGSYTDENGYYLKGRRIKYENPQLPVKMTFTYERVTLG